MGGVVTIGLCGSSDGAAFDTLPCFHITKMQNFVKIAIVYCAWLIIIPKVLDHQHNQALLNCYISLLSKLGLHLPMYLN